MRNSQQSNRQRGPRKRTQRDGFTVLEIIVTVIVFGVVLSIVVSLTRQAIEQRRRIDSRRAALLAVSTALERLEANPQSRPEPGEESRLPVPQEIAEDFDSPRLVARARPLEGDGAGLRLDVSLTWMTGQKRRSAPIELSTIVFPNVISSGGAP